MKALKDSILEKLDLNRVNLIPDNFSNMITDDIEDVIKFLKDNGFKEIKYDGSNSLPHFFIGTRGKYYTTIDRWVAFVDTSKKTIVSGYPVFYYQATKNNKLYCLKFYNNENKYMSEKEFIKELTEYFGWS